MEGKSSVLVDESLEIEWIRILQGSQYNKCEGVSIHHMSNEKEYKFESIMPEYTSYEISYLLNEKLSKFHDIDELCKHYDVDKEVLQVILRGPKLLSLEMYKVASKILEKPIEELTEIKMSNMKTSFRKSEKCLIEDIKEDLDLANMMFNEMVINAKINIS